MSARPLTVMAGLVPAIHVLLLPSRPETWMPGHDVDGLVRNAHYIRWSRISGFFSRSAARS